MTREEARETLEEMWELLFKEMRSRVFEELKNTGEIDEFKTAHEMAIAALKAEPSKDDMLKIEGMCEDAYEQGYLQARSDYEAQPCEDCMDFPNTFDDFAQEYKIVDRKEVYTNGSELIPIFRVKQWLEHTKTQPCVDAVSREAALNILPKYRFEESKIAEEIKVLPSVTPSTPTSTDCVSREAVREGMIKYGFRAPDMPVAEFVEDELPSVTPERPSVDDVCKILSDALGTPCNYGLDGEEVCDVIPAEWCEDNCPNNEDYSICWKKYFEIKSADMRGEQK